MQNQEQAIASSCLMLAMPMLMTYSVFGGTLNLTQLNPTLLNNPDPLHTCMAAVTVTEMWMKQIPVSRTSLKSTVNCSLCHCLPTTTTGYVKHWDDEHKTSTDSATLHTQDTETAVNNDISFHSKLSVSIPPLGLTVTLTFDLLTSKSNQFVFVANCI